jgi:hypothetical protein
VSRLVLIVVSLVALGISLALPALVVDPPSESVLGLNCFLLGWLSLMLAWPMWLANPLYVLGLIFFGFKKYDVSFGLGVVAIGLALCSLTITQIMRDEGGTMEKVTGLGSGFYLWLISLLIPTLGSLALALARKKPPG